jgi:hypothetical protein
VPELKKPLVYKTISHIDVAFVPGSLPQGEFVAGLPKDGSIISAPAVQAEVWIAAGIAKRAASAAEDKESE